MRRREGGRKGRGEGPRYREELKGKEDFQKSVRGSGRENGRKERGGRCRGT